MAALYPLFYNLIRIHKALRVTPDIQAGVADRVFGFEDILARINAKGVLKKRGPYRKKLLQISN
jgi:hypothetical protein